MRAHWIAIAIASATACNKGDPAAEARKEAAEQDKQAPKVKPADVMKPPLINEARVPCEMLLDPAAFTSALGETAPLTVRDEARLEAEAAASCSLIRGGERPDAKTQKKLEKEKGLRLGVLPGDPLCFVAIFCWTVESPETVKSSCKELAKNNPLMKEDNTTLGHYACVQEVHQGEDDTFVYKFFDEDTKCLLQVKGGPSNRDNEVVKKCANTARDTIGPAQIAVEAPPPPIK
jgi:hypothetical protein